MLNQAEESLGNGEATRGGIQALDAALHMLKVMATFPGPVSLSDLARRAEMPPSKVHRYLASFARAGFVIQRERSGKYDFGPEATKLGLNAVGRVDFVNVASDHLLHLAESTGLTALLTVWGTHGATVVRWERTRSLTVTSLGLGSTLPLLTSANGRVFLSYLPERLTEHLLAQELAHARETGLKIDDLEPTVESVRLMIDRVRKQGLATVDGGFIPGLRAVAAPILNWQNGIEASIALIGTASTILSADSAVSKILKATVEQISIVGNANDCISARIALSSQ